MTQPFNHAMGQLRQAATMAGLSVEQSPWTITANKAPDNDSVLIVNTADQLVAVAVDRYIIVDGAPRIVIRPPEETLRTGRLIAEAPVMRMVCEALARSGPEVAQALAYHQVQVPADLALATHLARAIVGRLS